MRRFCNIFFVEFEDSYTLLDVYNIYEKLELAHAHYEAFIMFKALASTNCANQIITFFFKTKAVHSVAPILPYYNYSGNPTHKVSDCNIPSEDLFCDYCGKKGHQEAICFAKFSE